MNIIWKGFRTVAIKCHTEGKKKKKEIMGEVGLAFYLLEGLLEINGIP